MEEQHQNSESYFDDCSHPQHSSNEEQNVQIMHMQSLSIEGPAESNRQMSNAPSGSANNTSGGNLESEQMKIFVSNSNVSYHTRHARRIYVGGIPPNYSDEEELRNFFNKVISKGLEVENDNSYVISVYMNQKKCYAFVEFNSIELTTACLEMDGIIFKKVTLKIYRANEYRPDLVPPTKFVKLDLTSWAFGISTGAMAASNGAHGHSQQAGGFNGGGRSGGGGGSGGGLVAPYSSWGSDDFASSAVHNNYNANSSNNNISGHHHSGNSANNSGNFSMSNNNATNANNNNADSISSLIEFTNIAGMEPGSVVIVGFPFESPSSSSSSSASATSPPNRRTSPRGAGTSAAPNCLRRNLINYPCGAIFNPELGVDLSQLQILDVGDVLAGHSKGETKALLGTTITELLVRGSIPFLVGGSRDQTYHTAVVSVYV